MATSSFMGDLNLVGDHDAFKQGAVGHRLRVYVHVLHLNILDYPFLALAECHVGDGVHARGSAPTSIISAGELATPDTR